MRVPDTARESIYAFGAKRRSQFTSAADCGRSSGENFPRLALETVRSVNKEADVGERPQLGGSTCRSELAI
jgi:hypothetical protein